MENGFAITAIQLDLTAKIPGAVKEKFEQAANNAKAGCPVSKLFANNAKITLTTHLESLDARWAQERPSFGMAFSFQQQLELPALPKWLQVRAIHIPE